MKSKTNISVLDNIGLRRNVNIEIGEAGNFPSGDLLDANATESLINEHVEAMTGVSDAINTKQDIISDLDTIRSGAAAGATALQQNEADELYQPKGSYLTLHQDISGKADKSEIPTKVSQLTNDSGFTTNTGTITGIIMNGQSKGTSGVVDLGTVITQHLSLENYATKAELEAVSNPASEICYGITWTSMNATPYRTGNMSMHKTLPIQSKMRRCMLQDDGTVYGYIDPEDYTKYTDGREVDYSGAHGQYSVEIPEYWYTGNVEAIDGGFKYSIDLYPVYTSGLKHSPKIYVGAVEASTNDADTSDSTKKLFSICTADIVYEQNGDVLASNITTYHEDAAKYLGGDRTTTYTGVKSLLGRPATNQTRSAFRTKAAARGAGWSQLYWDAYMAWTRLYVVEYSNFDSQSAYNANKTADGYMQGGLGVGVSEVNGKSWSSFNSYNPFVPCGVTKRLGNETGVVNYVFAANEFKTSAVTIPVPSYRGIENPFGHILKWTDGINVYCDSDSRKSTVYTCNDITKFADDTQTGYTMRTSEMIQDSEGWIKTWLIDENADFIPLTTGGSQSSYLCDYVYASNSGWRVLRSGGLASVSARCGLFYFYVGDDSSDVNARIGGRLYYTAQN